MAEPSKNKFLVGTGMVVLAAVVFWVIYLYVGSRPPASEPRLGGGGVGQDAGLEVTVPEVGSTAVPENVAVPEVVVPAAPASPAKLRIFSLRVEKDKFIPDTVVVNVGDTVHLNITATDKDYDFFQPEKGFNGSLPKGETKVLEFQADTEGRYALYCARCGGPENGPVAQLVIVKKNQ